jgi:hypothetical protein
MAGEWFSAGAGKGFFLFGTLSKAAMGPTQPPIQRVPEALSLRVERPRRESNHSCPSSADVKNSSSYASTPPYVFKALYLIKHRDNSAYGTQCCHIDKFLSYIHSY